MFYLLAGVLAVSVLTVAASAWFPRYQAMLCTLAGIVVFVTSAVIIRPSKNPDPNHTHADFAVWIQNERVDFAKPEYMSGLSTDDHSVEHEGDHDKYFHLHDGNGDVIHRHKPDLTLAEFFATIGMKMTDTCFTVGEQAPVCNDATAGKVWHMVINGQEDAFNPSYAFRDLDKILLTYGSDESQMYEQYKALTDEACLFSQVCRWRPPPPVENCIADPEIPCRE